MWRCNSKLEHQTIMPLMQVQFPGAARDFSPRVNFQCCLFLRVSIHPCMQSRVLASVHMLKVL